MIEHLGVRVKDKPSNNINKETYLSANPEGMKNWNEDSYNKQRLKAEINYDANMKFYESLDSVEFEKSLKRLCNKFKLKEIHNLKTVSGIEGVYLLVLDKYKQVYIGVSKDIKKRILSHWQKKKSLERLIFGDVCNSGLSIDSFGTLDTTRVFFKRTTHIYEVEEKITKDMDGCYMLNRTVGGIGSIETNTGDIDIVHLSVIANRIEKNLVPYIDFGTLKSVLSEEDIKYYLERYPSLLQY